MTDHEIKIKDTVGIKDKTSMGEGPTKEQIESVEKQLVLFLLDLKKTCISARDVVNKVGFTHLGNSLNSCVNDIQIYLDEYEQQKSARNNAK